MSVRAVVSSEGSTETRGPAPRQLPHVMACWQEASVLLHVGLSTRLPECPQDMLVAFTRVSGPGEQGEVRRPLGLALEDAYHQLCCALSAEGSQTSPGPVWEETMQV